MDYDRIAAHAQSALDDEINWIASTFGVHARGEVQLGKASQVAAVQPDMLVIGARGEHEPRVSPAALGGTALKLILQTQCPLLLVRGWDPGPYKVAIAAVHEAGEVATRVVFWGTALVQAGECHIFHAYEAPYVERLRLCGTDAATIESALLARQKAAQHNTEGLLASAVAGARVHIHVVHGEPLGSLVTQTALFGPQLVVVGRHEGTPLHFSPEQLGALSLRMAYHTPVDVLIVP